MRPRFDLPLWENNWKLAKRTGVDKNNSGLRRTSRWDGSWDHHLAHLLRDGAVACALKTDEERAASCWGGVGEVR
jgi:hypothetical protein